MLEACVRLLNAQNRSETKSCSSKQKQIKKPFCCKHNTTALNYVTVGSRERKIKTVWNAILKKRKNKTLVELHQYVFQQRFAKTEDEVIL